jgi:hypothetical protein
MYPKVINRVRVIPVSLFTLITGFYLRLRVGSYLANRAFIAV